MHVIDVPASLDYRALDALLDSTVPVPGKGLFDARHVRWVDPCGMLALLAAGTRVGAHGGELPHLQLPDQTDVLGYLARMGFFTAAEGVFDMNVRAPRRTASGESDVLLEITPITTNSDVHEVVDRVQGRAGQILSRTLRYPLSAVVQFSVILSEVCQNILEHAEAPGWVAAQAYRWQKRLGRHVLVISVVDLGQGFRGSLTEEHSVRFGDRWGDATALEAAFIHGLTRFPDSGRGQGIQQIRKQVRRWDGVISIRSGRARIADVPTWDDMPPLTDGMEDFSGAAITIILPGPGDDDG